MLLNCSISGAPCEVPVVSPQGLIFEKRLIDVEVDSRGVCPITGAKLSSDQLIEIKKDIAAATPKLPGEPSVPSALNTLRDEWDLLVGEYYQLQSSNEELRHELSQALYYYDASTRVLARTIDDLKMAQLKIESLQNLVSSSAVTEIETEASNKSIIGAEEDKPIEEGLRQVFIASTLLKAESLAKARKKAPKLVQDLQTRLSVASLDLVKVSTPVDRISIIKCCKVNAEVLVQLGSTIQLSDRYLRPIFRVTMGTRTADADVLGSTLVVCNASSTVKLWKLDQTIVTFADDKNEPVPNKRNIKLDIDSKRTSEIDSSDSETEENEKINIESENAILSKLPAHAPPTPEIETLSDGVLIGCSKVGPIHTIKVMPTELGSVIFGKSAFGIIDHEVQKLPFIGDIQNEILGGFLHPDGKVVGINTDGLTYIQEFNSTQAAMVIQTPKGVISSEVSNNGIYLALGTTDVVCLYDLRRPESSVLEWKPHMENVESGIPEEYSLGYDVKWHPDGTELAVTRKNNSVIMYNIQKGEPMQKYMCRTVKCNSVIDMGFAPDYGLLRCKDGVWSVSW